MPKVIEHPITGELCPSTTCFIFDKIFGTVFGSESKQKSSGTQRGTTTAARQESSTQRTQQTQQRKGTEETVSEQETTLLDEQTLLTLQNLIQGIAGAGGTGLSPEISGAVAEPLNFARLLTQRALGTEGAIAEDIDAIVGEARRTGEQELTRQGTRLSEAAGSSLNTVNADLLNRGRADLESGLASLAGQLGIRGRELASQDLSTAFAGLVEGLQTGANVELAGQALPIEQIAALAQILKGATAQTTGRTVGQFDETTALTALSTIISQLTGREDVDLTETGVVKGFAREPLLGQLSESYADFGQGTGAILRGTG